ncbi:MAG TPA: DUF4397 domain-containing protein [Polyangiaceae bacterium]|jgi:hypothetical protein|nr:DUF4397 domain-containing protein [Polyangiaceae bacterium]
MKISRKSSFASLSILVLGCATSVACSNDDNGSSSNDGGTGGSVGESGGSGGTGATGSGGKSTGGSGGALVSTGGSSGAGAGGLVITVDGGVIPRDSGTGDASADAADAGAVARFRVVHAAPGAGAVDIYVSGTTKPVATNIDYGAATPYLALDPGTYKFDLRAAGATASSSAIYTTPSVDVAAGIKYTAIAEGNIASTDAADEFRVATLPETFAPATAGKARIRVVHANYDGPTVSLDIGNDNPKAPEVADLKRFADTGEAGVEVDANAAVQVGVVVGTTTLTAFTTPKLDEGADVFVIATGLAAKLAREPTGLAALAVLPDSTTVLIRQNPRLYTLHASIDAGAVDVFSGATELIDSANFGDVPFVQVPPGALTMDLFAAVAGVSTRPVGAPVATLTTPILQAGNSYLGVVAGTVLTAPQTVKLGVYQEGFDLTKPAQSLLRVVHGSADTGTIDVSLVSTPGTLVTPPAFPALAFGDASGVAGTSVAVAPEKFGVAPTGTTSTLAEFNVTTMAPQRAFAVVAGSGNSNVHPLQLVVVDTTGVWAVHDIPKN